MRFPLFAGRRWLALPRAQLGVPLPPGELDNRMTGPGFDLQTASTGAARRATRSTASRRNGCGANAGSVSRTSVHA